MPYIGVKVKPHIHMHSGGWDYDISVKLHGPLDVTGVNTVELKQRASELIISYDTKNFPEVANRLANDLRDIYCNGHELIWVQVDIIAKNDVMYGASAERVLVS
jgi:hypothetical protein